MTGAAGPVPDPHVPPDRASFLEGVTAERQRVLETARQWFEEGKLTRQEHGAICAVVLIDDRPLSEEQLEKVRARFLERFPDFAQDDPAAP